MPMRGSLLMVALLTACGGAELELDVASTDSAAVSTGANDSGTSLSVTTSEAAIECLADESGADVSLSYTVTSTASADSAVISAIVDGGETQIGEIASGAAGWSMDGRIKTATGAASFTLANGDHTIQICATQSGARGRLPKRACSSAVAVTVDCERPKHRHCDQGVGNGSEGCDPGNSNNHNGSNDEGGGSPGNPGRSGR
jgi:hypothetical protein